MKYKITLLIAFLLISIIGRCQDVITKTNGEKITVKVIKAGFDTVTYKLYDDPDVITTYSLNNKIYSIATSDISWIIYKNGNKQTFKKRETVFDINSNPLEKKTYNSNQIFISGHTYLYHEKQLGTFGLVKMMKEITTPHIRKVFISGTAIRYSANFALCSGATLAIAGTIIYESNDAGIAMAYIGAAMCLSAIPLHIIGKSIQRKMIDKYNQSVTTANAVRFDFGITKNGPGIILSF